MQQNRPADHTTPTDPAGPREPDDSGRSDTPPAGPTGGQAPGPTRRRAVLWLALLAGATALALWGHYAWLGRDRRRPAPGVADVRAGGGDEPAPEQTRPADLLADPLARANLTAVHADPADVAPPPASRRLWCFRRGTDGWVDMQARYEIPRTIDQAASYYTRALTERGWSVAGERDAGERRRTLIFHPPQPDNGWMIVRLRSGRAGEKIIHASVSIVTGQPQTTPDDAAERETTDPREP